jgi:hypothetical protein
MERLLVWSFLLLTVAIIGYVVRQAVTGKRSVMSIRNFFLAGVIVFQLTSAATAYATERYGELPIGDPVGTGFKYLFSLTTFLILFLAVYDLNWFTFGIQRRFRMKLPIPGTGAMVILSIASLGVAAFLRLVVANMGEIGILAAIAASAMAAMAAATASWIWAANPKNLPLLGFMLLVVLGASALSMYEAFGRREILSVVVGCLVGTYYGGLRHLSLKRAALPLAAIAVAGFLFLAAFTATRGYGSDAETVPFGERIRRLAEADLTDGTIQLLAGQDAASNSLWIIENRPEPYPYDPLASLKYFLVHPMPRIIWEDKPMGLGSLMVEQSMVSGKGPGFSYGPGLVGHIFNDNPWIALPLYALLLGASMRIVDDLTRRFPNQPYIVLPFGIELGEILGLSRGEMGFFLFRAVAGMICAYVGTMVLARLMHAMGFASFAHEEPAHESAEEEPALAGAPPE